MSRQKRILWFAIEMIIIAVLLAVAWNLWHEWAGCRSVGGQSDVGSRQEVRSHKLPPVAKRNPARTYSNIEIVDAIWMAEGADKTRFPFGICWVENRKIRPNELTKAEARITCLQSVRNGRARWEAAGRPCGLIEHIGRRYSPPEQNPHWVGNVMYFLEKQRRSDDRVYRGRKKIDGKLE